MFDSVVSAVFTALLGALLGALLSKIATPFLDLMRAGQFSSAESAQSVITYLSVATDNWLRAALLSAVMVLFVRAVVESQVRV